MASRNSLLLFTRTLVIQASLLVIFLAHLASSRQVTLRVPDIRPDHEEQYLCIAHRLPVDRDGEFIVGFKPIGQETRVHHMLMYGCQLPGILQRDSPNFVWECGEMGPAGNQQGTYERASVCRGQEHIIYGWAKNAPSLKLPEGVGFKVGDAESRIRFLVLQVHYGHYHAFQQMPDLTDNSGLILELKPNRPDSGITRQAGVLLLISLGRVPTGRSRHQMWCDIDDDIEIHPFRFRVHTHQLGTQVMGAKLGQNHKGVRKFGAQDDLIIGIGDPQKPQMFNQVKEKNLTLRKGDTVYAQCEFNNNNSYTVNIGPTGKDEMCNFYLMYWTDSPKLLSKDHCFSHNFEEQSSFLW